MPERLPEAVTSDPRGTGPDSAVEVTFAAVEALVPDELTLEQVGAVGAPPAAGRRKLRIGAWLALGWMAAIIALAILAPVLPLDDPDQINAECVGDGSYYSNASVTVLPDDTTTTVAPSTTAAPTTTAPQPPAAAPAVVAQPTYTG